MDFSLILCCLVITTVASLECEPVEVFRCPDGTTLHDLDLCDGYDDCENGEDELLDRCTQCTEEQFKCSNGFCVDEPSVCDGYEDCSDASDEVPELCDVTPCTRACPMDHFRCGSSCQCVPNISRCNGFNDCNNKADELIPQCGQVKCLVCVSILSTSFPSNSESDKNITDAKNAACENGEVGDEVEIKSCQKCFYNDVHGSYTSCQDGVETTTISDIFVRGCLPLEFSYPLGCTDDLSFNRSQLAMVEAEGITNIQVTKNEICVCDTDECTGIEKNDARRVGKAVSLITILCLTQILVL